MSNSGRIKVLVADDSALMRKLLTEILERDPNLEVVAVVSDAYQAREKIKSMNPDVLTLDVEMPGMDGISFLEKLMRLRPMPVVMISSVTEKGADVTLKALMLGAVDFISKPKANESHTLEDYAEIICQKVRTAAKTRVTSRAPVRRQNSEMKGVSKNVDVLAVGASTGGVETIHQLLSIMPENMPPIMVVQHIPAVFSRSFADRLNGALPQTIKEAGAGEKLEHGHVYIAPGDQHMTLAHDKDNKLVVRLRRSAPVNGHCPSVDVLFDSVAEVAGRRAVGVLLTGMGADGARGLLNMHQKGAMTVVQDEASSVVWGMPKEAVELDAVDHVLPLDKMVNQIIKHCSNSAASSINRIKRAMRV